MIHSLLFFIERSLFVLCANLEKNLYKRTLFVYLPLLNQHKPLWKMFENILNAI